MLYEQDNMCLESSLQFIGVQSEELSSDRIYETVIDSVRKLEVIDSEVRNVQQRIDIINKSMIKPLNEVEEISEVIGEIKTQIQLLHEQISGLFLKNTQIEKELQRLIKIMEGEVKCNYTTGMVEKRSGTTRIMIRVFNKKYATDNFIINYKEIDGITDEKVIEIPGRNTEELVFDISKQRYEIKFFSVPRDVQIRVYELGVGCEPVTVQKDEK